MRAVFKRELKGYFYTPLGYIFAGVFLTIASLIFYLNNVLTLSSDLAGFFSMMSYVWMLLCPLLVMRLIAGERRQMTEQLLFTAPISLWGIILGKFFAALSVLLISILLSLVYPLLIAIHSRIYPMELLTSYLGFALQGCAFIAFDLMISSLSRSPTSASLMCFGANLLLWLSSLSATGASLWVRSLLRFTNLYERFSPFLAGQLSFANIIFFIVFSACCVFLCGQIVGARRWRSAS